MAGVWRPELHEHVQMVVNSGDLWTPGLSTFRGRYWNVSLYSLLGAAGGWVIRFAEPVVIDGIHTSIGVAAASQFDIWTLAPDVPPVNAAPTAGGTWIDQKLRGSERPPIFISSEASISLAGETAPTSLTRIVAYQSVGTERTDFLPTNIHLPAGAHILARCDVGGNEVGLRISGRIF